MVFLKNHTYSEFHNTPPQLQRCSRLSNLHASRVPVLSPSPRNVGSTAEQNFDYNRNESTRPRRLRYRFWRSPLAVSATFHFKLSRSPFVVSAAFRLKSWPYASVKGINPARCAA